MKIKQRKSRYLHTFTFKDHTLNYAYKHSGGSGVIGMKVGTTSKHHYVYWHTAKSRWANNFTNDTFDSEDECALFVNKHLDGIGDDDRPRNAIGSDGE